MEFMNYIPIRKVALAALAFAITFALRAIGVDLGPELVNELALGAITLGTAFAVKDPRVKAAVEVVEHVADEAAEFAEQNPTLVGFVHTIVDKYGDALHIEKVVDQLYVAVRESGDPEASSIDVLLDDDAVRELIAKLTAHLASKA